MGYRSRKRYSAGYLYFIGFFQGAKRVNYKHASGYLGSTNDLTRRIRQHKSCSKKGSPLVKAAIESGLSARLICVVPFENFAAAEEAEHRFKKWNSNQRVLKAMKRMPLAVTM